MVAAQAVIVNTMVTLTTTKDKRGRLALVIAHSHQENLRYRPDHHLDLCGSLF